MLRANDLIWSFVVNNYLLGKDPVPFDLLHWNADSTRMPACMHTFYLRNMYVRNALREPGGISLGGVPIDVRAIKQPAYFISTAEDHIAPWKTTFEGAKLLSGPVRFVLGGSGHIAGIVNPPAATSIATGPVTSPTAIPTHGLARRSSIPVHGGPTGPHGSPSTPERVCRHGSRATASSRSSRMRRAAM